MENTPFKYDIGVIHGRFQVFHNDHLKYLLTGKLLCRHMVVGITNPDPSLVRQETADPNRSRLTTNPLTYYERYILIRSAMQENHIRSHEFSIVPLPINRPELYKYYVPLDAVFFLSIYDDWGEKKLSYFESMGLKTHIIRKVSLEEKGISAGDIRHFMINNQPWEHLLPKSVARLMKQWKISERLQQLNQSDDNSDVK
ncbi:MAG: nicotinate-nucleotide adenylyltransferase [Desulfobacterales bacterium]|jgi:nicotinamide-nucleotide adenylyltransferase